MAAGKRRTRLSRVLLAVALACACTALASRWFDAHWRSGVPGWWFQLRSGTFTVSSVQSFGGATGTRQGWTFERLTTPAGPAIVPAPDHFGTNTALYTRKRLNGFGVALTSVSIALLQPTLLLFVSSVTLWWWGRRAYRRVSGSGTCPRCGYDTSGLPRGAPCPECGPSSLG